MHKMRPCLQKLDPGFSTYGFVSLLGPIGPKLGLRPQTPKATFLQYELDDFWESYEGLSSEDYKKNHQKFCFWCHSKYEVLL